MYREPKAAKRLYFDVIPRTVDEYYQFLAAMSGRTRVSGCRIRSGTSIPAIRQRSRCRLILHAAHAGVVIECRKRRNAVGVHRPLPAGRDAANASQAQSLVQYAIHYFRDFVLPEKKFREPTDSERAALT